MHSLSRQKDACDAQPLKAEVDESVAAVVQHSMQKERDSSTSSCIAGVVKLMVDSGAGRSLFRNGAFSVEVTPDNTCPLAAINGSRIRKWPAEGQCRDQERHEHGEKRCSCRHEPVNAVSVTC